MSACRESMLLKKSDLPCSFSFDSFPTILEYSFSINLLRSSSATTTGSIATPLTNFLISSIAKRLFGFTMARERVFLKYLTGSTLWLLINCSGISMSTSGSGFNLERKIKSRPFCAFVSSRRFARTFVKKIAMDGCCSMIS